MAEEEELCEGLGAVGELSSDHGRFFNIVTADSENPARACAT